MLLSPQMVRTTRPDYRPTLTPRGTARRTVLELCDGTRALASIEEEVFAKHRTLFRDAADAAVFVAEVVSVYSE